MEGGEAVVGMHCYEKESILNDKFKNVVAVCEHSWSLDPNFRGNVSLVSNFQFSFHY